jgi:hypothetical protein
MNTVVMVEQLLHIWVNRHFHDNDGQTSIQSDNMQRYWGAYTPSFLFFLPDMFHV